MAPTASTLYKQQSRYSGKLTREYSASGLGTIYWSSSETLGITAGWFQIDAENTKGEELFITGITGTPAEYSGTVSIRGLRNYGANTNVPAKQFVHRVTASIIVSDNHSWTDQMIDAFLAHEQLQSAFHGFAGIGTTASRPASSAGNSGMLYWSTDDLVLYYSDGTTWTAQSAGVQPDSSSTVKGVSKLSVAASNPANPIVVGDNDPRVVTGTTSQRGVFIEATASDIIAGTQIHGSGVELAVNPKFLADASVSTSAGVGDANKYIRLNASGALSSTFTGVSLTADNSGSQGDLLQITGSNTAGNLKRNITKEDNYVLTVTNSGTPDTFSGFVNNNGQKLILKDSTNIMGIYNGDDVVRVFHLEKSTTLNTWSVKYSSSAPTSLSNGAIEKAFIVDNSASGNALVCGYNGSSLVFSKYPNGLTAPSTATISASGGGFTTCNLTTDYELVFYDLFATGYRAVVVNHTGVPALGSAVTISSRTGGASMQPGAIKIGSNKSFLIFPNSADNAIQGMVVSVSGTTITTNTAQTIESGSVTSTDGVIFAYSLFTNQGVADKAVVVLRRVSGAITAYLIEVSGTTFTATAMTGLTSQNFYGLLSSDAVLVGSSISTAVGYKIDTANLKFVQCTTAYDTIASGTFTGVVYDSNQALSTVLLTGTTLEIANISPTHNTPLVALGNYTNGGSVVATNRGEVTVPAISGSAGDTQYLTFSGISNTRINKATVIGVAKNTTTIILS